MGRSSKKSPPASTPEARENQLISLAVDLAEKQLREGTASPSVITHYLKLGTSRAQLEKEKLARENLLLEAKTKSIESSDRMEMLYKEAIDAMRSYAGLEPEMEDDFSDI